MLRRAALLPVVLGLISPACASRPSQLVFGSPVDVEPASTTASALNSTAPVVETAWPPELNLNVRPLPLPIEQPSSDDARQEGYDSSSVYINDSGRYLLTSSGVLDIERDTLHHATTDEARLRRLFGGPFGWSKVEPMVTDVDNTYVHESLQVTFQAPQLVIADMKNETILVTKRPVWWLPHQAPPPLSYFSLPEEERFHCWLSNRLDGAWLSRKYRVAVLYIHSFYMSCLCGDGSASSYHAVRLPVTAPL